MQSLQADHGTGHAHFHIADRGMHGTALTTTQGSSSSHGSLPSIPGGEISSE